MKPHFSYLCSGLGKSWIDNNVHALTALKIAYLGYTTVGFLVWRHRGVSIHQWDIRVKDLKLLYLVGARLLL